MLYICHPFSVLTFFFLFCVLLDYLSFPADFTFSSLCLLFAFVASGPLAMATLRVQPETQKAQVNVFGEELCNRQKTWLEAIFLSFLSWMLLKELDLNEANLSNLKYWCLRKRRRSRRGRKRKMRMKRQKGKMKAQVLLVAH